MANRIKAIVGGTTAEKLQRLWDRNADVIYGDTSSFEQYTQDGVEDQLKMTMFGSCGEVKGVEASKEFIYNKRDMCKELIEKDPSLDTLTQ